MGGLEDHRSVGMGFLRFECEVEVNDRVDDSMQEVGVRRVLMPEKENVVEVTCWGGITRAEKPQIGVALHKRSSSLPVPPSMLLHQIVGHMSMVCGRQSIHSENTT